MVDEANEELKGRAVNWLSSILQNITKGNHNDEECEVYCRKYKAIQRQQIQSTKLDKKSTH